MRSSSPAAGRMRCRPPSPACRTRRSSRSAASRWPSASSAPCAPRPASSASSSSPRRPAHGHAALAGADERRADGARMVESLKSGLAGSPPDELTLIAASDLPVLTTAAIAEFLAAAKDRDLDVAYAIVSQRVHAAAYPQVPHTWAKMVDGRFCGGGLAALKPRVLPALEAVLDDLGVARKSPLRLAALFGWDILPRFALGSLTVAAAERRASAILRAPGRCDRLLASRSRGERRPRRRISALANGLVGAAAKSYRMILVDERRLAYGIDPALVRYAGGDPEAVLSPAAFVSRGSAPCACCSTASAARWCGASRPRARSWRFRRTCGAARRSPRASSRRSTATMTTRSAASIAEYRTLLSFVNAVDAGAALRRVLGQRHVFGRRRHDRDRRAAARRRRRVRLAAARGARRVRARTGGTRPDRAAGARPRRRQRTVCVAALRRFGERCRRARRVALQARADRAR